MIDGTLTWAGAESLSMLSPNSDDVATGTFTPSIAENGGDKIGYLMAKPTDGTAALELEVTIEAPDAATSVPTEQTVTLHYLQCANRSVFNAGSYGGRHPDRMARL